MFGVRSFPLLSLETSGADYFYNTSDLCHPLVSDRETPSGFVAPAGYHPAHYRFQADLRRITRVHEAEANVLVSYLLFPHGRRPKHHSVCIDFTRDSEFADFNH